MFQSQVQSQGWQDKSQDPPTDLDEGGGQVVYTDEHRFEGCCWQRWWAQGQEIVQVMTEEGDIIIVNQNPFTQIRNGSKHKRC